MQKKKKDNKTQIKKSRNLFYKKDLRNKAEVAYKDMEDWLGARFLKEMESIDAMSQLMRNAVEAKEPLADEIEIFQEVSKEA